MTKEREIETETKDLVSDIRLYKNKVLATQSRFNIMFVLYIHRSISFTELQRLLELTPGNLDHHLKKLKQEGYITIRKTILWRPLTMIDISSEGTIAFKNYAVSLSKLLKSID